MYDSVLRYAVHVRHIVAKCAFNSYLELIFRHETEESRINAAILPLRTNRRCRLAESAREKRPRFRGRLQALLESLTATGLP